MNKRTYYGPDFDLQVFNDYLQPYSIIAQNKQVMALFPDKI